MAINGFETAAETLARIESEEAEEGDRRIEAFYLGQVAEALGVAARQDATNGPSEMWVEGDTLYLGWPTKED